jgi:fused signal recognition particle receptor
LVDQVKQAAQGAENLSESRVKALLKAGLRDALIEVSPSHRIYKPAQSPLVILVVGVNGVGKTTTVAKLAARYHEQGKKVVLVAADTFRAAAVQQLLEWGRRLDVQVVSGSENAKPGTVVFDGMVAAQESSADVVLIDTAGRLHTKANLMQELEGIRNAIRKHVPDAPHETVLVLDGVSGQNALAQAREFNDAVELTGLVITKLDGTPRGGIVVAISRELEIPVFYVGVGERAEDLVPFSREEFTDGLLGDDGAGYGEGVGSYTNDLPISHESAQKENGSFTTH